MYSLDTSGPATDLAAPTTAPSTYLSEAPSRVQINIEQCWFVENQDQKKLKKISWFCVARKGLWFSTQTLSNRVTLDSTESGTRRHDKCSTGLSREEEKKYLAFSWFDALLQVTFVPLSAGALLGTRWAGLRHRLLSVISVCYSTSDSAARMCVWQILQYLTESKHQSTCRPCATCTSNIRIVVQLRRWADVTSSQLTHRAANDEAPATHHIPSLHSPPWGRVSTSP